MLVAEEEDSLQQQNLPLSWAVASGIHLQQSYIGLEDLQVSGLLSLIQQVGIGYKSVATDNHHTQLGPISGLNQKVILFAMLQTLTRSSIL